MLRAGEVFAGYVIKRQLGHGGMGAVYLARHPRLPRLTAVKLLNPQLYANEEIRARFEREADLAAQLDHPNIVTVYDRGVEDGRLWISMQYVDGLDAGTLDPRTLAPERAVEIIAETAKALDYAHAVGVLHRDVKPANIMLARGRAGQGERVLLTDFGVARLRDEEQRLTRPGSIAATLAYASPEQLAAVAVGPRSDQYSLACSLFWLLSGSTPFAADSTAAMVAGHMQQPPPPVSSRRPGLPPALDAVLAKAMAKRPDERFGSCTEFALAARQALTEAAGHPQPSADRPMGIAGVGGLVMAAVLAIATGIMTADSPPMASSLARTTVTSGAEAQRSIHGPGPIQPVVQIDAQGAQAPELDTAATPAGDGKAVCQPIAIAVAAPVSGQNSKLGATVSGGARLAVDQFVKANPGCHVSLLPFDTTDNPQVVTSFAPRIANDPSIVAVIGPVWGSDVRIVGQSFSDAELPFLTPTSTSQSLSKMGWRSFFRGLAASNVQGPALARYLVDTARFRKICVVKDNTDYGADLSKAVSGALGAVADSGCAADIAVGERDFTAAVSKVAAAAPDAIVYAGAYPEAAVLVRQLKQAGVTAAFAALDSTYNPNFPAQAGESAKGTIMSCACGPFHTQFTTDYKSLHGLPPGAYSVESYDLTTIVLKGIASGHTTRRAMLDYLRGYHGPGLARTYKWTDTGELASQRIWIYKVN
nr:bifunctional serine/threonine-protein kinase/ABC transporter substrate-binding protein [Nocardia transvalensis]